MKRFILRALLPSWRFFDELGHVPRLSYRTAGSSREFSDWQVWTPKYKRSLGDFFVNADGNVTLAKVTLLERLIVEIGEIDDLESLPDSVAYQLVANFVRDLVRPTRQKLFQFRVAVVDQRTESPMEQEILTSFEHEV